jgi:outer membrane protein assembly factor BamD (BamD/ComL family)
MQYNEAVNILRPLYQTAKNKPAVGVNLGLAYFYLEDYKQAIDYLSQYIEQFPHLKEVLYNAYLTIGDRANAQKLLSQR